MSRNRDECLRAVTTRDSIQANSMMLLIAHAEVEPHCKDVNAICDQCRFLSNLSCGNERPVPALALADRRL